MRTEAYREAIDQVVRPGDCVVDVGTGSGVLALFALRAGAEQVHAVEITDIITLARSVAERNGGSKIVFHRGDASTLELGVDADVIVSESMGAFALYEGMFKHVVAVRDRCLRSGGTMIPSAIELWLAPMDGSAQETPGLGFWLSSPYGIDMSPFLQAETSCLSSRTERVNPASLLAPPARLTSFDCLSAVDSSIDEDLAFVCVRDGVLEGFCGHFDAILSPDVTLTTSPTAAPTHWRQHVFPCQPVALKRGEELEVHFEARTSPSSPHQPLFFISARRRGEELFTHRFNAW